MRPSALKNWLSAARPQTLPAAFTPVLLGAVLAWYDSALRLPATLVALFCAFLIQIGTNFANDYFDHVKGADTGERIGFARATSSGLITPGAMWNATLLTMTLAFIAGLYLVWVGGWVILAIGLSSILFGILYTGGPFPLGYNGLGDLFVFIFFGFAAVMGTYYVNALEWSEFSFWASAGVGALSVNILVVNNLRDLEQDRKAGKRTLGVFFGETALKMEYLLMVLIAMAVPPHFYFRLGFDLPVLLPLISAPIAGLLCYVVWSETEKPKLNKVLERTAQYMAVYGILFAAGIVLSR